MIVVIAIARDEADDLLEWLAHHRAIGVDHCIVFDNDSRDGTAEMLAALAAAGAVTAIPWPTRDRYPGLFETEAIGPQAPAYQRGLEIARADGRWRWAGFVDLDEFVVPDAPALEPVLERHAEAGAVALNWRTFGSAGLAQRGPGLLTAQLTRRAEHDWPANLHVKSFARVDAIRAAGIHLPRLKPDYRIVDTDGHAVDPESIGLHTRIASGGAWINHYYVKTQADYVRKLRRGRVSKHADDPERTRDPAEFALHDRNEVEDRSIARFRAATLAEHARLSAIVRAAGVATGATAAGPALPALPDGFDPAAYLRANPDVAAAGVDPVLHWLAHGRREGRRLRPD